MGGGNATGVLWGRGVDHGDGGQRGAFCRRRDRFVAMFVVAGNILPPSPFSPPHLVLFIPEENPPPILSLSLSFPFCVSLSSPLSCLFPSLTSNLLCLFRPGKFLVVSCAFAQCGRS